MNPPEISAARSRILEGIGENLGQREQAKGDPRLAHIERHLRYAFRRQPRKQDRQHDAEKEEGEDRLDAIGEQAGAHAAAAGIAEGE